jgi:hypothetical protein
MTGAAAILATLDDEPVFQVAIPRNRPQGVRGPSDLNSQSEAA